MPLAAPVILLAAASSSVAADPMQFTDVTHAAGVSHEHHFPDGDDVGEPFLMTGGGVAEDFDGDGWIDLYALQADGILPNLMYINEGDGTFSEEGASRGSDLTGRSMGACAADFDGDGDIDICVTMLPGPHALLVNDGTGHFGVDVTTLTLPASTAATSPSWGDVDGDGLLDLVIGEWMAGPGRHLWIYRNVGEGALVPHQFRTAFHRDRMVFAPRFADVTGDRLQDLLVVCDFGESQLYHNTGDGLFARIDPAAAGTGVDQNGMGSAVGDIDNDGDLDWFVSSIFDPPSRPVGSRLYRNRGDGLFDDVTVAAGVIDGFWGWGSSFGDLDLDGDLDLFHVNGWPSQAAFFFDPSRLFENLGDGTFTQVAEAAGAADRGQGRGAGLADFDRDGDLDIFIFNNTVPVVSGETLVAYEPASPMLLRNDTETDNHWLTVTLVGESPLHAHGIGSRVHVTTGALAQMRELHASSNFLAQEPGRIAHFGLGNSQIVGEVRAEWVNGDAVLMESIAADQAVSLPSPQAICAPRIVSVDEPVTASAVSLEPLTDRREWIIEGQVHPDPVMVTFATPGSKDLRLNVYEGDSDTLRRAEILRVTVVTPSSGLTLR